MLMMNNIDHCMWLGLVIWFFLAVKKGAEQMTKRVKNEFILLELLELLTIHYVVVWWVIIRIYCLQQFTKPSDFDDEQK